jgi:hypothetical protein
MSKGASSSSKTRLRKDVVAVIEMNTSDTTIGHGLNTCIFLGAHTVCIVDPFRTKADYLGDRRKKKNAQQQVMTLIERGVRVLVVSSLEEAVTHFRATDALMVQAHPNVAVSEKGQLTNPPSLMQLPISNICFLS